MPTQIDSQQRRALRRIGHQLNTVIQVGDAGISEGVIQETRRALGDHELIKVRLPATERETRKALAEELCAATDATLIQSIGRVILIYTPAEKPDPRKSNVLRNQLA